MRLVNLILILTVVVGYSGAATVEVPQQHNFMFDIDDLSNESTDIQPQAKNVNTSIEILQAEDATNSTSIEIPQAKEGGDPIVFEDPKVYGMNIGLHYILESINARIITGQRVHLESLIKVLVLTHKIEQVGGKVNGCNRLDMKRVAALYPKALRKAMEQS